VTAVNAPPCQIEPIPERILALQFDETTADALSIVTLLSRGRPEDAELAAQLLRQATSAAVGPWPVTEGLLSICGALLALLEFHAGQSPDATLQELGRLVADATLDLAPLSGPDGAGRRARSRRADGRR
jgi:hypothetical protein